MSIIDEQLEVARRGSSQFNSDIALYIKQFKVIVLRGAGNFGRAFGSFLLKEDIEPEIIKYWDIRAKEIGEINGIHVEVPFTSNFDPESTLIINCIPNGSLSGSKGRIESDEKGYKNYLSGMAVFESLMCGIKLETGFDPQVCLDTTFCNWCSCKRLSSLMPKKQPQLNDSLFIYPLATFVISQKCTLSCAHCGQYINHYTKEERINFPLERVKKDIDDMFNVVDGIGYVSIIGGEPFVHPELDKIIDHILSKDNFGVIGITTNGVCDMDEALLKKLNNGRTRIIFSDYTAALSEKQKKLFEKNVEKVNRLGLSYTVGRPVWATPASLRKLNLTEEEKIFKKTNCHSRETCKTIQNGVYYPCTTTAGMGSHRLAEFKSDWVELDNLTSVNELKARILEVDEQPYYESCDHCGEDGIELAMSGEQGVSVSYIHIDEIKRNRLHN